MNRSTLLFACAAGLIAATLIGISLYLRPPADPDGPPPGFVIPDLATKVGGSSGQERELFYDPARDPQVLENLQSVITAVPEKYQAPRELTEDESRQITGIFEDIANSAKTVGGQQGQGLQAASITQPLGYFDFFEYLGERARIRTQSMPEAGAIDLDEVKQWHRDWKKNFEQHLDKNSKLFWDQVELLNIMTTADEEHAVLTVRIRNAQLPAPELFRMKLRAGGVALWRIYDISRSPFWLWTSATLAEVDSASARGTSSDPAILPADLLMQTVILAHGKDEGLLDKNLAQVRGKPLPPMLQAWRAYAEGRLALLRNQPADADKFFQEAIAADPIWPPGYLGKALAANHAGRSEDALKALITIKQQLGIWPPAAEEEAKALEKLGRKEEAAEVRNAAQKLFPTHDNTK